MKQFWTILKFELTGYFKNKVFVGLTVLIVVVLGVVMTVPGLLQGGDDSESAAETSAASDAEGAVSEDADILLLQGSDEVPEAFLENAASAAQTAFPDYRVEISDYNQDELEEAIAAGDAEAAFVLHTTTEYTYYVETLSMYDYNTEIMDGVLTSLVQLDGMEAYGMSAEEAMQILQTQITGETVNLGKDQMSNFFYTYIMVFALYMVILIYGQMVATNVATEKSSRAMELLVTSARPNAMIFGKVIGAGTAGLLQLAVIFGAGIGFYRMNAASLSGNAIIASIFDVPVSLLGYMLLFFLLGFFLYAFLYGAIGSTASKLEDMNTAVMPLTFLFIFAMFVVIFSMSSGSIDNIAMLVCSFVPFTSPMAMFARIAMSTVPVWQILISIVILIVSVIGTGVLSARIYRIGILMYGTKPQLRSLIKAVRETGNQ